MYLRTISRVFSFHLLFSSSFYICLGALIKNELVHQDFVQIHSSANDLLSIVNRG